MFSQLPPSLPHSSLHWLVRSTWHQGSHTETVKYHRSQLPPNCIWTWHTIHTVAAAAYASKKRKSPSFFNTMYRNQINNEPKDLKFAEHKLIWSHEIGSRLLCSKLKLQVLTGVLLRCATMTREELTMTCIGQHDNLMYRSPPSKNSLSIFRYSQLPQFRHCHPVHLHHLC